jgi:hypothetical protein
MPDDKDNQNEGFRADSNAPTSTPPSSRWKRRGKAADPGAKGEQPQASQAQASAPGAAPAAAPAATPRKKSHWLRRSLLTLAVLLLVLAALLPTIASTDFARGIIVSQVNDRIVGKVAMGNLSLSWFGNCSLAGLGVTDPQGRKVVDVAQVNWDRNLWNLLWSRQNLGKLDVGIRSVDIIQTADGSISLLNAFAMRQPSPPAAPQPSDGTFNPTIELNWTADHVRVVQPDGRQYATSDTKGMVQAKTLNDILVDLGTTLLAESGQAKGSRLTVHAAVRDLFAGGNLNLDRASGTLSAKTDSRIAVKPILAFAAKGVNGQGDLGLDVTGNLAGGKGEVTYSLDVKDLSAASAEEKTPVPPLTAKLAGGADYKDKKLHATLDFSGSTPSGNLADIQSEASYDTAGKTQVNAGQIWDKLVKGQSVELPDFHFKIPKEGHLNLAEAIKSVPGLVPLRNGAKITGGDLKIAPTDIQGGAAPSAQGGLTLVLTVAREGQPPERWEPITVGFKVITDADKQVKIENVGGDFGPIASMQGSGSPAKLHLAYQADLSALRDRLNEVFDLDKTQLGGKVSGTLDTARATGDDKRIDVTLDAKADGLVVGGAPQPAAAGAAPAPPTAYTGEVQGSANLEQLSDGLKLAGKLEVPELKISSTGEVLPNDHPVLDFDLALYTNQAGKYDRLEITKFGLESQLLKAHLNGPIDHLTTDMLADIKGDYTLSWPLATKLAKQYYPDYLKSVSFVGDTKYDLVLKGPLTNPSAMQVEAFPAVEGNTGVGWGNGSAVYGLTMGDANLAPSLANGKITLPVAKVPANGGTLGLGGLIDLSNTNDPRLIINDHLDVMDHVGLNTQVGHDILSMALPLLANMSELDGTVSLWVEGVNLPLNGQRILREGTGRGHLDFSSVRLRPTGPMAQLMKLTGLSSDAFYDNVKFSPVDFTLNNGALNYDNFTLTIGQNDPLDLRFHGSIRFDGSLVLFVSVPVKASMLSEFGFKDPTGQIAKVLDGERIDIPISGSRTNSNLDLSKVNVKPLVDQAIKKMATGGLLSNLPGLPGDKSKTPTSGPAPKGLLPGLPGDKSNTPTSGPAPKNKPAGPLKIPGGLFK